MNYTFTCKISCTKFILLKWIYLLNLLEKLYALDTSWTLPYSCPLRNLLTVKEMITSRASTFPMASFSFPNPSDKFHWVGRNSEFSETSVLIISVLLVLIACLVEQILSIEFKKQKIIHSVWKHWYPVKITSVYKFLFLD